MLLSAPIYRLKRRAKELTRQDGLRLHEALDHVAKQEGFTSWSHLASTPRQNPAETLLSKLGPGDMVLLGARPGHGKTLLGLELAAKAGALGMTGLFFTLSDHERDVADRLSELGMTGAADVVVDTSDTISAAYILDCLRRVTGPCLVVIDYLQLLDQRRCHPSLQDQITALCAYVKPRDVICAVISQIDRSFDLSGRSMPDPSDVRLPNPLDLSAFDKACFLHDGRIRIGDRAAMG